MVMRPSLIREEYRHWRIGMREIASPLASLPAIRLHSEIGPLWMHRDDQVMTPTVAFYGTWEPETLSWLRSSLEPGMIMLDIGANIGYFTLACAEAIGPSGRVIALEPDPDNYVLLCANLFDAGVPQVYPLRVAAADFSGVTTLALCDENRGDHRTFQLPSARRTIAVECIRLDDMLCPDAHVDLVKIDTQGADHRVVQGMRSLIARSRPRLHVEFWPDGIREGGEDPSAVLRFYRTLGLAFSLLEAPTVCCDTHSDNAFLAAVNALPGGFGTLVFFP